MPMPLEEYQFRVSTHLDLIEAGAQMCARHARRLAVRPDFETLAEDHLKQCEAALRRSLITVIRAQAIYRRKRIDR